MWCPNCGAEYRPGFTRCPDCDVDLVAEEPAPPEPAGAAGVFSGLDLARLGPDPAVVYVGPRLEVEMMRSVLAGSDIECAIRASGLETYGVMLPASLLVRADDAERANDLVLAARTGDLDLDEASGAALDQNSPTRTVCPSCGVAYWRGVTHCPDCDVELVVESPMDLEPEGLLEPGAAESRRDDWMTVFSGTEEEAELVRSTFEGHAIQCAVYWASSTPAEDGAPRSAQVLVFPPHVGLARRVLGADGGVDHEARAGGRSDHRPTAASSDPIAEVTPWWKHPELPALLSAARVVLILGAIVGIAYLIFTAVAD